MHFNVVFAALLDNPARLLEIAMTEGFLPFAAIVAGVMQGCEFFMPGLIDLDPFCLDILLQKIMDRDDPVFLENLRKPVLQTKPGRIIGVPSLRQEERFAIEPLHMLHDAAYEGFHGWIIP